MFPTYSGNIAKVTEKTREMAREFVKRELRRRHMSRATLAREAKVDPKTLRTFLSGERWPQEENRVAISTALGWQPDEIDRIEKTGELRGVVRYRDEATGEVYLKPLTVTTTSNSLAGMFGEAVFFLAYVADNFPTLTERAEDAIRVVTGLFGEALDIHRADHAANRVRDVSVLPDRSEDAVAAHEEETPIAGEQGVDETP